MYTKATTILETMTTNNDNNDDDNDNDDDDRGGSGSKKLSEKEVLCKNHSQLFQDMRQGERTRERERERYDTSETKDFQFVSARLDIQKM